jgi:Protein of unknown function (DUF3025)
LARGLSSHTEGFAGAVLAEIDWSQPWFAPWRARGEPTAQQALQQQSVAEALNTTPAGLVLGDAKQVKFVPQSALPEGQAYEDFIFKTQQVPTRDGLHDFFNGLCWHRFPLAKRRLNQLQAAEIEAQGIRATRGPVRDALTLFDENAVLMHAPDALWAALQARDWHQLFVELRGQWQHVSIVLFGHALLEKLVTPYKSITGHVYRVANAVNPHDDAALDTWLAQDLQPAKLATKPYEPLPVLGVPDWWPANAECGFYEDAQVFRPKREVTAPSALPPPACGPKVCLR